MPETRFDENVHDAGRNFQAAQSTSSDIFQTNIDLFRKGVQRTIESQRQVLEAASELNTETVDVWRKIFANIPGAQPVFNFAEQTVDQFIDIQLKTLDILGQQSAEFADTAQDQGERATRATKEMTESATSPRDRQKSA
jgi:hypothetical protein